ncbi:hypothetical protein OQA88_1289 [Cercophora sp. LCS_1]
MSLLVVVIISITSVIALLTYRTIFSRTRPNVNNTAPYREENHHDNKHDEKHAAKKALADHYDITPLPTFSWSTTPPLQLRPFKPKYHITMALQNTTPSDLITMDNTYRSRVLARRATLATHPSTALGCTPQGHAPVAELYRYLLSVYLPARYPTVFSLQPSSNTFVNLVTGLTAPLNAPDDPLEALKILGETVEEDLFLLLKQGEENREHRSVAVVCCHPSGFDPSEKVGKRLAEIHGPVPGYEKIGASMERFFAKLEVGRGVKRVNWGIQTHGRLWAPSGNHVYDGDETDELESVDAGEAMLRVELQTLTRLPETGAILFSFKTYLYPLAEIKEEGLGGELADAIEGLKKGNAPGMWIYKGSVRWGRAVCEYLRAA